MQVTNELVEKIAHLARLKIAPADMESTKNDLQKMIAFVDKLNDVDTTGVTPALHASENINVLRADEPNHMLHQQQALQNAPQHNGVFFKVPRVIN
jgi:aspartyl-tRNA(Asn)/glutamyl-tRNA(Gln) amidotransferase subunit C